MLRLILLFAVVVATVVFVNWLLKEDPKRVAAALRRAVLWGIAGLALLLVVTGRIPWLLGLIGAAVPVVARLLSLLRYAPIISRLYTQYQNARTASAAAGGSGSSTAGTSSHVRSKYLHMTLNHDSGEMDGEILRGSFQGQRLSGLGIQDLLSLLKDYQADDSDSAALLQAYLDRYHGGWDQQAGQDRHNSGAGHAAALSKEEAAQILGVKPDATPEEIISAHRRLMQKLHPDRGGSDYLAAKINQAKDLLLGN